MNKKFDCVKMKNEIQQKIFDEIKPKNIKEYVEKINKSLNTSELFIRLSKKEIVKT